MKYLRIQNKGVAPLEGFTLLGMSMTRNDEENSSDTIGEFGSGTKHAINLLLRKGLSPTIYCGKDRLTFSTKEKIVNDGLSETKVNQVLFCINDTPSRELNFVVEYGEKDWNDLSMALREFVANAIDRTIRQDGDFVSAISKDELSVEIVSSLEPREEYTRIFIPLNEEIQKFYGELPRRFLHFSDRPELVYEKVLTKNSRNLISQIPTAVIYKKGVYVREIDSESHNPRPALFDYNFGDELKLDECRNASDYIAQARAAEAIREANEKSLTTLFSSLIKCDPLWEKHFDGYYLNYNNKYNYSREQKNRIKSNWKKAWQNAVGVSVLCRKDSSLSSLVSAKGHTVVEIENDGWLKNLEESEVVVADSVLSGLEKKGKQFSPATDTLIKVLNDVWSKIHNVGLTNGLNQPKIACFTEVANAECQAKGVYNFDTETVYVEKEYATGGINNDLWMTVFEEVVHHITKSKDGSRDLQEFFLKYIVRSK